MRIEMEVDAQEFVEHVLGSCFDTWSWWQTVKYDEGYSWDVFPDDHDLTYFTIGATDPDDVEEKRQVTKRMSVNDIAKAFVVSGHRNYEDMDASSADWVMQHALFGEAIYG
jgi:hypothetical protein